MVGQEVCPGHLSEMSKFDTEKAELSTQQPSRRAVEMRGMMGLGLRWVRDVVGTPNLPAVIRRGTVHTNGVLEPGGGGGARL